MEYSKASLLDHIKPHVPFDGWSKKAVLQAAKSEGIPVEIYQASFHNDDAMVQAYLIHLNHRFEEYITQQPIDEPSLTKRIGKLLFLYFSLHQNEQLIVKKTIGYMAKPKHLPMALKSLYATTDLFWKLSGDHPHDFSFYTKRLSLALIYISCLFYWLGKPSSHDLERFINRQLERLMTMHKQKIKLNDVIRSWKQHTQTMH